MPLDSAVSHEREADREHMNQSCGQNESEAPWKWDLSAGMVYNLWLRFVL